MKRSPLTVIFITVFIDLVGFGMIIPLGPFYATTYGATAFQVGLLMGIYSLLQFFMSPFWGQVSDRIGRRPILLMSLAGAGISHIFFGLSNELWMLFVARGIAGFFGANVSTAMAYVADVTGEADRSKGMGLIGAAFGLGFVLGPAIGGLLALWSPSAPAFGAGIICLSNFVLAIFVLKESLPPEKRNSAPRKNRIASIASKIRRPFLGDLLIISLLVTLALASLEATLFLYVKDVYDWDIGIASFGFAYIGLVMAITQGFFIRKLIPKYGEPRILLSGLCFYILAYIIGGFETSVLILAVAMTSLAIGAGFTSPSLSGSLSLSTSSLEQGEVLGVFHSLSALARIIGPPLGGLIYSWSGPQSPFFFSMGLVFAALLLTLRIYKRIPSALNVKKSESSGA